MRRLVLVVIASVAASMVSISGASAQGVADPGGGPVGFGGFGAAAAAAAAADAAGNIPVAVPIIGQEEEAGVIEVDLPAGQSAQILIDGVLTTVTDGFVIPDGADVSFPSGNTGSVTLAFSDGTTVDLTPGSEVTVSTSTDGTPTVEVASGDVSVDAGTGGSVSVTTPDGSTTTGDEFSVAVNDDGTTTVENDGTSPITVETSDGQSETVVAGGSTSSGGDTEVVTGTVEPGSDDSSSNNNNNNTTVTENALQDTDDGSPQDPT